ncbi:LysE family translocator [Thiomicrospira pelophila]|uniref:LysE family translocator n=1 Tax=Thiomicrospira pelophila TaxID=934 RepID=UPI0004A6E98E|nr:LysE family translocator [Thiomicrospira pelophila]
MSITSLISLIVALMVIAASPGPGVLMTITRSLQNGFRAGAWVVAGIVLMDVLVLILTLSGLSLIAQWSQPGLVFLQFLGALFLIWLSWQSWHRPIIFKRTDTPLPQHDFLAGIIVSLTNPVFFYLAFLPAFIDVSDLNFLDSLLLIALIGVSLSLVLLSYAFVAAHLHTQLLNHHKQIWMNRLSAFIFLALAIWLALSSFTALQAN